METRVQVHVSYRVAYHIVWIPKYRKKVLVPGVAKYCDEVIRSVIIKRYPDVTVEELYVMKDHVHIMLVIPPKYSVSTVVGRIKADSSRSLRQKFTFLTIGTESLWSIGYFVSTIGLDEVRIRRYIQNQEQQDKGQLKAVWDQEATGRA